MPKTFINVYFLCWNGPDDFNFCKSVVKLGADRHSVLLLVPGRDIRPLIKFQRGVIWNYFLFHRGCDQIGFFFVFFFLIIEWSGPQMMKNISDSKPPLFKMATSSRENLPCTPLSASFMNSGDNLAGPEKIATVTGDTNVQVFTCADLKNNQNTHNLQQFHYNVINAAYFYLYYLCSGPG